MTSDNSSMFTVTPEDFTDTTVVKEESTSNNIDDKMLKEFCKRAEADGYSPTMIDNAAGHATGNIHTYEDFEELIGQTMDAVEAAEVQRIRKMARIQKSIDMEINNLSQMDNVAQHADNLIQRTYNTTAVTALDILKRATDSELRLEVFKEPIYSLIIQMKRDWVANHISAIHNSWETNQFPRKYVEGFLKSRHIEEPAFTKAKQDLVSILPTTMQSEHSPSVYKQFRAVQLMTQQRLRPDASDNFTSILENPKYPVEYMNTLEHGLDGGMPAIAASTYATQTAIRYVIYGGKTSMAACVFCEKAIGIHYKAAKTYDGMLQECLGKYCPDWNAMQSDIASRRAMNIQPVPTKQSSASQKKVVSHQEHRTMQKKTPVTKQQSANFNPNIPTPVIVGIIHAVVALFTFAIFGKTTAMFGLIGLVAALVGFVEYGKKEKAILTIVGGYAIYIVAILLVFI